MKNRDNRAAIDDLAASEDGVFTSGQAARVGIPRYALAQAARAGYIERLEHGGYRMASRIDDGLDSLRAAYKLTAPNAFTHERMGDGFDGVAARGATASYLLEIGDLWPTPWDFAVPQRFNSRRSGLSFRVEHLTPNEVIWRRGIPVTRPERTIADLVADGEDLSLVADVFIGAVQSYGSTSFDIDLLERMLGGDKYTALQEAARITDGDTLEIVRLDRLGHVALRERS